MWSLLKKILPYSLLGRFVLIIVSPVIILQLVSLYMFFERHWDNVSKHIAVGIAGEIAIIAYANETLDPVAAHEFIEATGKVMYLSSRILPIEEAVVPSYYRKWSHNDDLYQELSRRLSHPFEILYDRKAKEVEVMVYLSDREVLDVRFLKKRLVNPTNYIFVWWILGVALFVAVIAFLFARNQIRSIVKLAAAAEQFGRGQEVENFRPSGAKEIRQCANSFIRMQERLRRYITQRTDMLSGVSHDLRTPLTRMKLELSLMEESESIRALKADVNDMVHMVNEYLDYVKGTSSDQREVMTLWHLIEDMRLRYQSQPVTFPEIMPAAEVQMMLCAPAIRRALGNIIDNALNYGQQARVNVTRHSEDDEICISIEDDGPSIPEAEREAVFRPFYRLDASRNLDHHHGVGLGLSITRDIISYHGGAVHLADSEALGGLRVDVILPIITAS